MTRFRCAVLGALLALLVASPALAQHVDVPPDLEPWVDWVLHGHDELACPVVASQRTCAWPGRLEIALDAGGGTFSLAVHADRDLDLALPGDDVRWPRDVRVDGAEAVLTRSGAAPTVRVPAGNHTVSGRFAWSRLPESLAVPPQVALLDVTVEGAAVPFPRRQDDGTLWLAGGAADTSEEDRLAIEVHRRIDDGVPVVVTTRLRLRVSGRAREVDLGVPLPDGTVPIALNSTLPARLDGQGRLRVQLRPGDQTVTLEARTTGPAATLAAPAGAARWPEEAVGVFAANPAVRAVQLQGAPGVDPQRTSLDEDWRGLPAWRVARGTALEFVELRRGEADPPPDEVTVSRELWLADRGRSFIVRDRVNGELHTGGRLELLAPGELGHVQVGSQDRVINQRADGGAGPGVEVRDRTLSLVGELSYPRTAAIPAVGWNRDAGHLGAVVHLPPGWSLLATSGVDSASGTWVDQWSLLDLFFLLLIALVTWKTMDIKWAGLALLVLGLAWHEAGCPQGWWLLLLALHALVGALNRGWVTTALQVLRWAFVFGLAVHILVFSWSQVRHGLFPQLDHYASGPYDGGVDVGEDHWAQGTTADWGPGMGGADMAMAPPPPQEEPYLQQEYDESGIVDSLSITSRSSGDKGGEWGGQQEAKPKKRAARVDPQAVVQTGPGLPRWSWERYTLTWNGPVTASHEMRLILLPPWADMLLSILRVLGLVFLGLRFCDPRRNPKPKEPGDAPATQPPPAASAAAVALLALAVLGVGLVAPSRADAQIPNATLLQELEQRLTAPPECGDACVEVPELELRGTDAGLRVTATVHAQADVAFRLPGPDSAWLPTRVTVDGREVLALRRLSDGFLAVRLTEGKHRVVMEGPARDQVALQLGLTPRVLSWSGDGWAIDGYRPDAPPPASVRLSRSRPLASEGGDEDEEQLELPAWLELRRELDVGIPWLVHNELVRLGPAGSVVHARVPLLEGESVTTAGVPVEDGVAVVTLEGNETVRAWDSTLAETDALVLTAPSDQPWTERWTLDCSPIFSCSADGLAPIAHMAEGRWRPGWLPWPGEQVTLRFGRPGAVQGATSTVDDAKLELRPGRRVLEATLTFELRSSQGGEQSVTIPTEGQVVSFTIDGVDLPLQNEGGKLTFSTEPGTHTVALQWRQDKPPGVLLRAPEVHLSSGGANVLTTMTVPDNKWLLWAGGPRWGAVVTLWQYVLVLLLAAWLLGRYAPTTLGAPSWFVLGLGMTQVPVVAPIVVVLWLIGVGLRGRHEDAPWWAHDIAQVALAGGTGIAFLCMYWAVYEGLLFQPDMQVEGAGSWGSQLQWYADRTTGALSRPWVLWLPLWVWRILMLLWALWLAVMTFRWVTWAWQQASVGGLWKMPPKKAAGEVPPASQPPAPEPSPTTGS